MYTVQSFKQLRRARHESVTNADIARFWSEHIRMSSGQKAEMTPKIIQAASTVFERMYSIEGAEELVHRPKSCVS